MLRAKKRSADDGDDDNVGRKLAALTKAITAMNATLELIADRVQTPKNFRLTVFVHEKGKEVDILYLEHTSVEMTVRDLAQRIVDELTLRHHVDKLFHSREYGDENLMNDLMRTLGSRKITLGTTLTAKVKEV
jgi:hypothetical protein